MTQQDRTKIVETKMTGRDNMKQLRAAQEGQQRILGESSPTAATTTSNTSSSESNNNNNNACYVIHNAPGCGCSHCETQICQEQGGGRSECCSIAWDEHCVEMAQLYYDCTSCAKQDLLEIMAANKKPYSPLNKNDHNNFDITMAPTLSTPYSAQQQQPEAEAEDGNWAVRPIVVALSTFLLVMLLNVWYNKKKERSSTRQTYSGSKRGSQSIPYVELTPTATENFCNDFDLS